MDATVHYSTRLENKRQIAINSDKNLSKSIREADFQALKHSSLTLHSNYKHLSVQDKKLPIPDNREIL